jgi:hypothetical protein
MTTEEAIDILTKGIACQKSHCPLNCPCNLECENHTDVEEFVEAMKTMISRWQALKKYLKDQELLYSVNYKDIEKHEMIVSVIEEMEHDPD